MNKPLKILQASAGSGKTFSLAVHYLTLLFSGEHKYREILAVTFTNKATAEMKDRILEVLEALAKGDDSEKIADYRKLILQAHRDLNAESLKLKADKIYRKILHDYSRFSVSTIDGFVQKVIRGFAFELGLDAGYALEMNIEKVKQELTLRLEKLFDENESLLKWVVELALDRIGNNKSWNYKSELMSLSKEVFNDKFGIFEESLKKFDEGKTELVFGEYIKFSKELVKDYEAKLADIALQCAQIFNQSSADADLLNKTNTGQLRQFSKIVNADFSGINSLSKLVDNPNRWFKKNALSSLYEELNPTLKTLIETYENGLADYTLAKAFLRNGYYLRLMQEIATLLGQYRAESDTLLISDAQKLLTGIADDAGENPSFIWEKMGVRYRNFLFDEFQDTSGKQWNSFKTLLTNAIATHDGRFHDHLIVGDTKQSIYRWRDGDYKLLHQQAKTDVGLANVFDDSLQENYRSTEEIIKFNNHLYQGIARSLQDRVNEEVENDETLQVYWQSEKNKYGAVITSIYEKIAQKTHPKTLPNGIIKIKRITVGENEDISKKALALQEMVAELISLLQEKGYKQKEIGVLVRTNAEATEVVSALMDANLDVISGEALKIANSSAIQLIINVLKMMVTTPTHSALYKANAIALYANISGKTSNGDQYFDLANRPIATLIDVLPAPFCKDHQQWLQFPIAEITERIIASFGLDQYQIDSADDGRQENKTNPFLPYLLAFRDLVGKASALGDKGISSFLDWWDEEGSEKNLPSPETADAIQVLTIAKSKGLAFRAVFIPFCDWSLGGMPNTTFWVPTAETPYEAMGSLPLHYTSSLKSSSVGKHYVEELLFNHMDALNNLYVATTRAKDYLYLSFAGKQKKSLNNIGDAIYEVYEEDFTHSQEVVIGKFSAIGDKIKERNLITLTKYPTTKRLEEIYSATEDRPQRYLENIEKSGRRGALLHQILEKANQENEVEHVVDEMITQGFLTIDEKSEYVNGANEVLQHPALSALLRRSGTQFSERSLVDLDGKSKRPDKLIIGKDDVVIIDYKFTAMQSDSHVMQIKKYEELIKEMGYVNVKSYLFYAELKELREV